MRCKLLAGVWAALSVTCHSPAQTWTRLGPEGGMVVSLGKSSRGRLYLGTADGHIFSSTDAAQSWQLRGRVGTRLDAVVTRIVPDPRDERCVFAAVWYQAAGAGGGVFRSADAGHTWALLGLKDENVRALELAPSRPDVLVAGTRNGVFRSTNAGRDWERISPMGDQELQNVDSLAIDPQNPDTIYVGTYHLPWRTNDAGRTWVPVITGIIDDSDIMSLRIDATNPARLFMSACSGIYRSENQGGEWTKLQGIPYAARRTQTIVQDPAEPKTLYAGTTEGLWVTRDAGENWSRTTSRDWDINALVVIPLPNGGERVVLGTEGLGVEVSDDAGVHFAEANHGFTHVVVKQLLADPRQSGHFLAVLERSGSQILESHDQGNSWMPVSPAAEERGKQTKLNVDQLEEAYASPWGWALRMADGRFWLREDGKDCWSEWPLHLRGPKASAGAKGSAKATARQELHLQKMGPPVAFAANAALISSSAGLLRCQKDGGCDPLKNFGRGASLRALWVSPDSQHIVVISDGKLAISANGGATAVWSDLPVANEQVLRLDGTESQGHLDLFLNTATGLFVSDGAVASWQHLRSGLPSAPITQSLRSPAFWVVTELDGGVYLSRDQGASWSRVEQDAERSQFTGLVLAGPQTVLAGSQSEGLLRAEFKTPGGAVAP